MELKFSDAMEWKWMWKKSRVTRISRQPSAIQIMIDLTQPENVEYMNYLGSRITKNARCTQEITSRNIMAKAAFNKKKTLFSTNLELNLRKKLIKCYIWSIAVHGAQTWILQSTDDKYLESFKMWCWRNMQTISWPDDVRNEVLNRVKERNILHTIKKWLIRLVRSFIWTAFKKIWYWRKDRGNKWWEGTKEYVSSYWMTLQKRGNTGNWKTKH